MAPALSKLYDQNPFVLPCLLLLLVLVSRYYFLSHPGRIRPYAQKMGRRCVMVLGVVLGVCLVLLPLFEVYYRIYQCEVSQQYMHENMVLARKAMKVLAVHGIPFWIDYASLLNHLRSQNLNRWEQDVDLSLMHPLFMESIRNMPIMEGGKMVGPALDAARADPEAPGLPLSMQHLMEKMTAEGFQATYSIVDGRELIQLWGPVKSGPHVDLWMWAPAPAGERTYPSPSSHVWSPSDLPMLYTGEEGVFNPRPWASVFPLHKVRWLDSDHAWAPADPHLLSEKGYGASYMVTQVFRGDCFHNLFHLRFAY